MTNFPAVLFDNGDTLFYKPQPYSAIVSLAASLDVTIDERVAMEAYAQVRLAKRAITDQDLIFGRNRSKDGHRLYYTTCFAPLDDVAVGLADLFYTQFKTNAETMIPYPDTEPTLRALAEVDVMIGIVSNTGWNIRQGYDLNGLSGFISSFVLSFEHGVAKPDRRIWDIACADLDVDPRRVLMVGNNLQADSGAIQVGATTLLLPEVVRGDRRGLEAVLRLVGTDVPQELQAA